MWLFFRQLGGNVVPETPPSVYRKAEFPCRSAVNAPLIPPPSWVPKCTEGEMGLSRTFRQDFRNCLQFWVPPILRASCDALTDDIQNGCKFTVYFLTCPGSVILNVAVPHMRHFACTESLLVTLAKQSKTQRPWVPSLGAGIEEAALHLLNAASSP